MRNFLLAGSMMAMMLIGGAGCSTNDNYCCTSNDQCLTTSAGLHSCSMDTCGKCVLVAPLTITVTDWKDPNVGQNNYSVELDASGGIPPYTWEDFTIVNDMGGKLSWLTFKPDATDSSKAYLTNRVENNVVSVPSQPTEDNETLSIKVTVMDYTRHGKDSTRLDDVGYTFSHPIAINECPLTCINDDGCCPTGCTILTDSDCPVTCGDGVVSAGETCDTGIAAGQPGACPTSCTAPYSCTTSTLQNAGTCTAQCVNTPITPCCGNGIVETGETCDKAIPAGQTGACPSSCTAPNSCTTSTLQNAGTCTAQCVNTSITACATGGGCCPTSIAGVTFNMKYAPGGTFPTGTSDTAGNQTVSAFWMGETEVTYELWSAVYTWAMSHNYTFANSGYLGSTGSGSTQQPVTTINWRDAIAWCNAASELAGLTPVYYTDAGYTTPIRSVDNGAIDTTAGHEDNPYVNSDANGFQLPGSMEWECAARYIGTTNPGWGILNTGIYWTPGAYASGATADYTNFNADNAVAWFGDSTDQVTGNTITTQPVAGKTANTLGIYDMSGNVAEWCFEWNGSGPGRVDRGGDWFRGAPNLEVGGPVSDAPYNERKLYRLPLRQIKVIFLILAFRLFSRSGLYEPVLILPKLDKGVTVRFTKTSVLPRDLGTATMAAARKTTVIIPPLQQQPR